MTTPVHSDARFPASMEFPFPETGSYVPEHIYEHANLLLPEPNNLIMLKNNQTNERQEGAFHLRMKSKCRDTPVFAKKFDRPPG